MFVNLREVLKVAAPALLTCTAAWVVLLVLPGMVHPYGHDIESAPVPHAEPWRMLLALLSSWFLMLAAMMPPAVISPIVYIRSRSFASRRDRSVAIFIGGYAAVWLVASLVLVAIQIASMSLASKSALGASTVVSVALVWQCCPIKQICINRCHAHRGLAAFGDAADRDALRFGVEHGFYCVGSCWALMLVPMLLSFGHLAAMAIATIFIFADRMDRPRVPSWRWRGLGPLIRIAASHAGVLFLNLRTARTPRL